MDYGLVQIGDEVVPNREEVLDKVSLKSKTAEKSHHNLQQVLLETETKTRNLYLNAITALVHALEAKDEYTSDHSHRVAAIAAAIARELGLPAQTVDKIATAGLLHDIGKIGVRESVLNKPGKLTNEEYEHVISHCEIGERILSLIIEDKEILDMVRHHHERYDGTGQPDGLSAKQIPLSDKVSVVTDVYTQIESNLIREKTLSQNACILAVADAFDSMMSPRSYRGALSIEKVIEEIRMGAGTQFDPAVAEALLRIGDSAISLYEDAERRTNKEAELKAREQAKREAEEARKIREEEERARKEAEENERRAKKEAEEVKKQAKIQAKLVAKQQAEIEAEEAKEVAEPEKNENKKNIELYKGIVSLVLPSHAGFKQFQEQLRLNEHLKIFSTGVSDEGGVVCIALQESVPLLQMLERMPIVDMANKKDRHSIVVSLKNTSGY